MPGLVIGSALPDASGERADAALAGAREIADRIATEARWVGPAATWQAGGREIDGRLAGGSAGVALFLTRLFEVTQDSAPLRLARGALTHAVVREQADGAAHGWYRGTAGVAATCVALGTASGDAAWLDEAVSLCRALGEAEPPPGVADVVGGAAGSILGLLAVHEATGDADILAAARRLGDGLLAKRRVEPEGISWNGEHAVARNLLGMAHGAGGIGLALLELFRATGEERFFAGASAAMRYEDGFYDPATGDWPDLRHPALAAYLDAGRMRELREAVASDTLDLSITPRPTTGWRYGTPGITLVRARFFELTGLERYRVALDHAAARCREHVGAAAAHDELTLDGPVLAAADALLERAGITGDGDEVSIAAGVAVRWGTGRPFSPTLLRGAAGIGLFQLRIASPRIPSPLLPGPASSGAHLPVTDETATRADMAGALEHFPRTERALAREGIAVRLTAAAATTTAAVREHLHALVAGMPVARKSRVEEALALETLAFDQARTHADRAAPLVRQLTRPRAERLDLADTRVRLAPSARLFHARHDWEPLLAGAGDARPAPATYLMHDTPGGYVLRRLDAVAERLLSPLETPTPVQALIDRVAADIDVDAGGVDVPSRLRDALRRAYEAGIVEMVDSHDLRPSDVTSRLCTHCGECCRVRVDIPGDAAYAGYITAVMEAPLRAAYPDLEIRHEGKHVVLDLGYCHHLQRGTDDAGRPTFHCGIYETRPDVCRTFNCVTWGRLQQMGSPARTVSDVALEKVAALKRALDEDGGAS